MSVCCERCLLSGTGLCDGLITRPEESYRLWCAWGWSWSHGSEEALAHWGGCCTRGEKISNSLFLYPLNHLTLRCYTRCTWIVLPNFQGLYGDQCGAIWEGGHAFRNVYFISKSRLVQLLEPEAPRRGGGVRTLGPWAMTSEVFFFNSAFRFHKRFVVCTVFNGKSTSNLGPQFAKIATSHSRSTKAD